ncbi:MAG: hypothetical protein IBX55_16985 [Methyloprofundus sp.]|nr:hypothetical protein [Methyloprofundus sp.]
MINSHLRVVWVNVACDAVQVYSELLCESFYASLDFTKKTAYPVDTDAESDMSKLSQAGVSAKDVYSVAASWLLENQLFCGKT